MPVTATAYSYTELDKKAKKKAIEVSRDFNVEYVDWWEFVYDGFKEKAAEAGYEVKDIYFSGFWSQGDGACFTGSLDVLKWLEYGDGSEKDNRSLRYWLRKLGSAAAHVRLYHRGHYYHRFCMYIELEWNEMVEPPKAMNEFHALEKAIIEDARDRALELYRNLEKEYEYLTSDEAVAESLEINEHYLFWQDGTKARIK